MPAITSGNWHRLSRSKFVVVAVSHPSDADAERTLRVPLYSFKTKPKPLTRSCSGFKTSLSNSSAKNSTRPSTKCCNSLYSTARSGRRLRRVSPKLMALTVLKVGRYKARLFSTEILQFPRSVHHRHSKCREHICASGQRHRCRRSQNVLGSCSSRRRQFQRRVRGNGNAVLRCPLLPKCCNLRLLLMLFELIYIPAISFLPPSFLYFSVCCRSILIGTW